jgi:TonB-dependent receptor-like protein
MSKPIFLLAVLTLLALSTVRAQQQNPEPTRTDDSPQQGPKEGGKVEPHKTPGAADGAEKLRRLFGPVPSINRGQDGLLNLFGQRATHNQLVTSTNVKDPVTDTFAFSSNLPLEAGEHVSIPTEQFTVTLNKFYATVPTLDSINHKEWHFTLGTPLFSFEHMEGLRGVRSAAPMADATGPLGRNASLFQSFSYRLSKSTIQHVDGGLNDSGYESLDWTTHIDFDAGRTHKLAVRFALFSQDVDLANLTALTAPDAAPDFAMGGGALSLLDTFTTTRGVILDTVAAFRLLHVRILPRASGPMFFIEQGELDGNYFDTLHRSADRFEWRESVHLPEFRAKGEHHFSFGGGLTRSSFDTTHVGNTIILRGEEEDELSAIFNFTGSPFESLSMNEAMLWMEDRWAVSPRLSLTLGGRYDRTSVSKTNEWAPRAGFALRPFKSDRTIVRGGAGVFFDIIPLNAGTFAESRQRIAQFFNDGTPISEVKTLSNIVARPNLRTPSVLGWNIELDQQVSNTVYVRVAGEERRGRDLLLVTPDLPGSKVTTLVLKDNGQSLFRSLEATVSFRPSHWGNLNASYVRSSSLSDTASFVNSIGTFEKLVITANRYAHARSDAPNRFLAWGDLRIPGGVTFTPTVDVHTGFPFAFVDADANVAPIPDFGRFPRFASLDLGLHRDFGIATFDRQSKLRLGFAVYNLANHFNPRDAQMGETEDQKLPTLRGFLNGSGRGYRLTSVLTF